MIYMDGLVRARLSTAELLKPYQNIIVANSRQGDFDKAIDLRLLISDGVSSVRDSANCTR